MISLVTQVILLGSIFFFQGVLIRESPGIYVVFHPKRLNLLALPRIIGTKAGEPSNLTRNLLHLDLQSLRA